MTISEAILLGLIQGITEFIPVSSSGHLLISAKLLGLDPHSTFSFDVTVHLGTLFALLVHFWRDLKSMLSMQKKALAKLIAIGTLPAVVIGFLAQNVVENHTRSIWVVIVTMSFVGVLMVLADTLPVRKKLSQLRIPEALWIGLAQAVALIPGVSRSGSTILAGRVVGLGYQGATRFAFLLAIPITAGAVLKVLVSESGIAFWQNNTYVAITGTLTAFVGGWLAISFMLHLISRIGLKWFGIYRVSLAILLSLLLINGVI